MKKIIPPFLLLFCIGFMVAIKNLIVIKEIIPPPFNYIGLLFIIVGFLLTLIVRKKFARMNTEIHTFKNPRNLVTTGPFKISRNPIYLGFTLILIGVWLLLGTLLPVLGCLLFIVITDLYYIPFEEKRMENIFGEAYKAYTLNVRRWL